ncbi:hypothetical protein KCG44_00625 [Pacificimonas sp. WHA3]|uniref:MFS transporter n=1 Tax=Pacificimonas pallii TaxID=2827236 RepID=A0ABS6SA88_9SPHN|nr:MFS transporter [Pacificimonas pallii]MBV7255279.1 hypothetical protein [Pacificimonas pallii]
MEDARQSSTVPDTTFSIVAIVLLGVLATTVLVSLPVLVAAMGRKVGGDATMIGYLASADMLGSAIASLTAGLWIRKIGWRFITRIAIAMVVAGNLASVSVDGAALLLGLRCFIGLFNGVILSVVFVHLCRTKLPDRAFGLYVFVQLLLQAALLPLFAGLLETYGIASLYLVLAAISCFSLIFTIWIPQQFTGAASASGQDNGASGVGGWAYISVIALAVYFLAPAAIWGFFEPIGGRFGLDVGEIAGALGMSAFAGIAGAVAVLLIGENGRRHWLLATGIGISMISVGWMFGGAGYFAFLLSACLFNFAWNFTFPYLMGVIAIYDEGGAIAAFSLAAQLFGLAAGPLIGSLILSAGLGFGGILTVVMLILAASLVLFLTADRVARRGA